MNGGYIYSHLFMSQNTNAEKVFEEILKTLKPKRILEIGTFHGGLTLALRDITNNIGLEDTLLRTYDPAEQKFLKPIVQQKGLKIDVRTKNVFSHSYLEWKDEESKAEIADYINEEGTTLVLCDGGCKRCEFNLIAPLLKPNDVIMAHDYAPNKEYFQEHIEGKIWDWLEIEDSHIAKVSQENNLVSYMQEVAQQAAWCCRIKG